MLGKYGIINYKDMSCETACKSGKLYNISYISRDVGFLYICILVLILLPYACGSLLCTHVILSYITIHI